ncbi:MAG: hypothetical protein GF320_05220, partial [Armatimonadia bacterium]|nr:hypothetical protein [Armatimonadia bacterium]
MLTLTLAAVLLGVPADLDELEARADAVHQALSASHHYMEGWLAYQDPETDLIPQRLDSPLWTPENSAA